MQDVAAVIDAGAVMQGAQERTAEQTALAGSGAGRFQEVADCGSFCPGGFGHGGPTVMAVTVLALARWQA